MLKIPYIWEMGFLLVKWVFLRLFYINNLSFANIDFYSTYLYSQMIIYQMIFWYHKTILGNGNYENHSINPFNIEWTNPPICDMFYKTDKLIANVTRTACLTLYTGIGQSFPYLGYGGYGGLGRFRRFRKFRILCLGRN
jgi:hypothetical protein